MPCWAALLNKTDKKVKGSNLLKKKQSINLIEWLQQFPHNSTIRFGDEKLVLTTPNGDEWEANNLFFQ